MLELQWSGSCNVSLDLNARQHCNTVTKFAAQLLHCEYVCNLLFISRYMRPEGPWQRLAAALADSSGVFIHSLILAQTDNRQF